VRPALIPNVIARPNLPDIVRFGSYRPHKFVFGDQAWPQNVFDMLATSTTNKASYQLLTHRCGILQWSLPPCRILSAMAQPNPASMPHGFVPSSPQAPKHVL